MDALNGIKNKQRVFGILRLSQLAVDYTGFLQYLDILNKKRKIVDGFYVDNNGIYIEDHYHDNRDDSEVLGLNLNAYFLTLPDNLIDKSLSDLNSYVNFARKSLKKLGFSNVTDLVPSVEDLNLGNIKYN